MVLFNLNLEATCFLWNRRNVKTTQCGRGILKTEYVYTEFPPWRRWHSDIDPQGANTKTTLFSVSKKALPGIDDYHQQHHYLKHHHHHQPFTIPAGIKVVLLLVPCISKSIPQVLEIKMNFLCCKNVAAWKRNEEVHKLQLSREQVQRVLNLQMWQILPTNTKTYLRILGSCSCLKVKIEEITKTSAFLWIISIELCAMVGYFENSINR